KLLTHSGSKSSNFREKDSKGEKNSNGKLKNVGSSRTRKLSSVIESQQEVVNPHDFPYLINEEYVCQKDGKKEEVFLMVVVLSSVHRYRQRQAIRQTWGTAVNQLELKTKVVFMLGRTNESFHEYQVRKESEQHHDIIQEDFIDTYRNLSIKTTAVLKWYTTYCNHAKYLLKTDEDMFVHIPNLIKSLKDSGPKFHKFIMGSVIKGAMPYRQNFSKWYVSKEEYSDSVYPTYISGTAYVISQDLVSDLYQATLVTPMFWLEDVYITGICAAKVDASHVHHLGFQYFRRNEPPCNFANFITGHRIGQQEMRRIWKALDGPRWSC
ncbi:beta-1,3-galactosyltransferase 1-like, partial [Lingula anatina]|uniref:Hexosyltransferase n=1 Tax=Lingula anatina TaxID=7574 RepID=A0A1S3JNE9_LINAN